VAAEQREVVKPQPARVSRRCGRVFGRDHFGNRGLFMKS
jgi:hypothetical protein